MEVRGKELDRIAEQAAQQLFIYSGVNSLGGQQLRIKTDKIDFYSPTMVLTFPNGVDFNLYFVSEKDLHVMVERMELDGNVYDSITVRFSYEGMEDEVAREYGGWRPRIDTFTGLRADKALAAGGRLESISGHAQKTFLSVLERYLSLLDVDYGILHRRIRKVGQAFFDLREMQNNLRLVRRKLEEVENLEKKNLALFKTNFERLGMVPTDEELAAGFTYDETKDNEKDND